mmetsp:Transcript_6310/g.14473  ORF Transcript_6310/g.14473 Transcript_6310/m.14473 type:complete len:213 (-) Transcript_6310:67-705(-)
MHSLQQAQALVVDGIDFACLHVALLLIPLAKVVDELFEVSFDLLYCLALVADDLLALGSRESGKVGDLPLLGLAAELHATRSALWLECLCMLLQLLEGPAANVVLQFVRIAKLDCGVALDSDLIAHGLAIPGAINVRHEDGLGILKFGHELVPVGFHLLAVAAPCGKKLCEDDLAGSIPIPGLLGELHGVCGDQQRRGSQECEGGARHFRLC